MIFVKQEKRSLWYKNHPFPFFLTLLHIPRRFPFWVTFLGYRASENGKPDNTLPLDRETGGNKRYFERDTVGAIGEGDKRLEPGKRRPDWFDLAGMEGVAQGSLMMLLRKSVHLTLALLLPVVAVADQKRADLIDAITGSEAPAAAKAEPTPELRVLRNNLYASGTVVAEIEGKTSEFLTTSTVLASDLGQQVKARTDNEAAQKFAQRMAGRTIRTAVLRLIGGRLYVTLTANGPMEANGPVISGEKATSVELNFTLDPQTLKLNERERTLTYRPPGASTRESWETKEYELKLESVTPLPDGSLALKGSFSGSVKSKDKDKGEAFPIKGTFDIQHAAGNEAVSKLLKR